MNIPAVTATAPAKINLSLDITGIRGDGYHLVRTVMQAVTLRETAEVALTSRPGITLSVSENEFIPSDYRNTAYKAAQYFNEFTGCPARGGISIRLTKHIPVGAGLAGGSADAAAVIAALDRLTGTGLSMDRLCEIGATVGADVPFCILGGTALGLGIGTELTPLTPLPDCHILIAKPSAGVSTAEAYRRIDRASAIPPASPAVEAALSASSLETVAFSLGNVFDAVAAPPAVAGIKRIMNECGALGCQMTGSGSAVFALFDDISAAKKCADRLEAPDIQVFLCRPDRRGAIVY